MKKIALVTALLMTSLVCSCAKQDRSEPVVERPTSAVPSDPFGVNAPMPADTSVKLSEHEAKVIARFERDLAWLAERSPTAAERLAFYRKHRILTHRAADGTALTVEGSTSPQWFAIVVTEPIPELRDKESAAAAQFITANRAMILTDTPFSRLARGLILSHELVHAEDAVLHGEPDSEPLSETWLFGEFHAHAVVNQILNEVSNQRWSKVIAQAEQALADHKRKIGRRSDAFAFGIMPDDSSKIVAVLGPLSHLDLQLIFPQYQIDTNMAMIQREAARDTAKFNALSFNLMTVFYRQAMDSMVQPK